MPSAKAFDPPCFGSGSKIDRTSARARIAATAILAAAAAAIVWPVLILPAAPTFRHDWIWPLFSPGWSSLWFGYSAWSPQNLGSGNLYPTTAPLVAWIVVSVHVLGARPALDLFCFALAFCAAAGAAFALRGFFPGRKLLAAAAGVTYLALPAFTDELIAGHYGDLLVYAAIPWVTGAFVRYARDGKPRDAAIAALSAAVCGIEVQFFVLVPVIALVWLIAYRSRRVLLLTVCVFTVLAACNATTIYQIIATHANRPLLNEARTTLTWVYSQSVPFASAVRATGYAVGYDQSFAGAAGPLRGVMSLGLFLLPFGVIGLARIRPVRALVAFALVGIGGVVVVSGLRGPAEPLVYWLFENFKAASIMRELFHAVPLYALQLAIGWVLAVDFLAAKLVRSPQVCGAIVAVTGLLIGAGPYFGAAHQFLRAAPLTASDRAFEARMASANSPWRVVVQPGRQPSTDGRDAGVDALAYYPFGYNWNMFQYFPLEGQALPSDLWSRGDERDARKLYELMSVKFSYARAGVRVAPANAIPNPLQLANPLHSATTRTTRFAIDLRALPEVYGSGFPALTAGDYSVLLSGSADRVYAFMLQTPPFVAAGLPYVTARTNDAEEAIAFGCSAFFVPPPSWTTASALDGWQDAHRYGLQDPSLDYPVTAAAVTQSTAALKVLDGADVMGAVISGSTAERFAWGTAPKSIAKNTAFAVEAAVYRSRKTCGKLSPTRLRGNETVLSLERRSPMSVEGIVRSSGAGGTLVFTDAYDPDWQAYIDGHEVPQTAHFRADGFANGWIVMPAPGVHRFALTLRNATLFVGLSILGIFAWVTMLAALLITFLSLGANRRPR